LDSQSIGGLFRNIEIIHVPIINARLGPLQINANLLQRLGPNQRLAPGSRCVRLLPTDRRYRLTLPRLPCTSQEYSQAGLQESGPQLLVGWLMRLMQIRWILAGWI